MEFARDDVSPPWTCSRKMRGIFRAKASDTFPLRTSSRLFDTKPLRVFCFGFIMGG